MTIISVKRENSRLDEVVTVEFSDEKTLRLDLGYLPDGAEFPALRETERELIPSEEEAFRFAADCFRAEKIALRLIARAEQNCLGLSAKLARRGFDSAVVKTVVSRLVERNFLDDSRFAELWLRSRLRGNKAFCPQWLLVSLGKKGVDRDSSRKALEEVLDFDSEYALLIRYLGKAKDIPAMDRQAFQRTHLKHLGFSTAVLDRYFDLE